MEPRGGVEEASFRANGDSQASPPCLPPIVVWFRATRKIPSVPQFRMLRWRGGAWVPCPDRRVRPGSRRASPSVVREAHRDLLPEAAACARGPRKRP